MSAMVGNYRFVIEAGRPKELGRGGFGTVYLAEDLTVHPPRKVALKMLHQVNQDQVDQTSLDRFETEVKTLIHLGDHPNIVTIYANGKHDGNPYFVMEYVEGICLAKKLNNGPLGYQYAASIVKDLAKAVQFAHDKGIIHRDIKPENVLLSTRGEVKLLDFGLARWLEYSVRLTRTGDTMGTPAYMSPEQARGEKSDDRRTDVYGLGGVLYACLTGKPPFEGENVWAVLCRIQEDEPNHPGSMNSEVPQLLSGICLQCLEKKPSARYQTAKELADALAPFADLSWARSLPTGVPKQSLGTGEREGMPQSGPLPSSLLATTASLWDWNKNVQPRVEYFANTTRRSSALEGHGRVTEEEARHRTFTYKFYHHGRNGPVEKVEIVNGHGELSPQYGMSTFIDGYTGALDLTTKRECRYEFKRDQQGQVIEEIASDRNGEILWIAQHTANKNLAYYADKEGRPTFRAPSGATYVRFDPDEEGREKKVSFLSSNARDPRPNRDGVFGMLMEYNERGLPEKITFLDAQGRPTLNKVHIAGFRVEYNDRGLLTAMRYFGLHNELVSRQSSIDGSRSTDLAKNTANPQHATRQSKIDGPLVSRQSSIDDSLALHEDGYAGISLGYDNYGNFNELISTGLDVRPTLNKNGLAKATFQYDDHGNVIHVYLFDADGKPTLHKDGYAQIARQYDERGRLIEESYFGLDGQPILTKPGVAKVASEYDDRGNVVRQRYFDTDGKLTLHQDGYAEVTNEYDDRGNNIRLRLFDTGGKPTLHKNGYAAIARKYNDSDRVIEETTFGTDGKPTLSKFGAAKTTFKYDDRDNKIEQAYFDDKGERTLHKDGNWKLTWKYNDNGDQIEAAYIGLDGKQTFIKDGYSRITWEYDQIGNKTEEAYYDPDGRPTLVKDGYAKVKMRYDRGNKIEQAYFDVRDRPILRKDGYWKAKWKYDDSGHQTEEAYFGLDGLSLLVNGVAKTKWEYDAQGNQIELANFGLKDEPVRFNGGHSKLVWKYDTRGNQTERSYVAPDGKPMLVNRIAKHTWEYDAQGNKVGHALFDLNDKPARHPNEHWSKMVWKYDSRGNQTEETYFDTDGKPMLVNDIAKIKMHYDSQGNKIEYAFYSIEDKPARHPNEHWSKMAWKRDSRGNPTEQTNFDTDGKPMLIHGVATEKAEFDNLGNVVEAAFYGLQGEPVVGDLGISKITLRYDPCGNQIEQATFDHNGKPTLGRFGNVKMPARMSFKYDDRGNQIESAWYGVDGKLTLLGDAAKKKMKYDPRGNLIEQTWLGPDDCPKKNYSEFTTVICKYDDVRGYQLEEAYYGPDGKPTLKEKNIQSDSRTFWNAGYAKVQWTYDDMNERSEATYFDVQGNRLKTQVCITAVSPNSPAKIIGLRPNDILVNYGGQEIRTKYTIENIKRSGGPGDKPKDLTVLRDGKPLIFRPTPSGLRGIEMVDQAVPGRNEPASSSAKKP